MIPIAHQPSKLFLIFLIITSMAIISCGESTPVQIGYVAGMSGRHSELGVGARNGVLLAIEKLNAEGGVNGRELELLIRDDEGEPSLAASAIQEFIDMDVPVVIGPLLSKMVHATASAIQGKNVLLISPTMSTDLLVGKDDNFLRLISESSFQGETIAKIIAKSQHTRIGVVYDGANSPYTLPIFEIFQQRMKEVHKELVYVNNLLDGQETKLAQVASELIASKCDAIFFITSSIDAGELSQQIRKHDKTTQLYGSYWAKSGKIIAIGGRAVEGMIFSTNFERENKSPSYIEFAKNYEMQFKSKPNFTSVYAYETVMVLAEGMQKSGSFDPRKIKEAILEQSTFHGLEEDFKMNQFGDVVRSKALVKIHNGQFIKVDI